MTFQNSWCLRIVVSLADFSTVNTWRHTASVYSQFSLVLQDYRAFNVMHFFQLAVCERDSWYKKFKELCFNNHLQYSLENIDIGKCLIYLSLSFSMINSWIYPQECQGLQNNESLSFIAVCFYFKSKLSFLFVYFFKE